MFSKLAELHRYRYLIAVLVSNELKLRYRRSALGFLWTMLNPLLMMIVLSTVFSMIMRVQVEDYAVLLLAGLLPWSFISQSVNGSLMSVIGKGSLLTKVYIPKAVLPISTVLANLVNFVLSLVPLLLISLALGHHPTWALTFLPVSVVIVCAFACGLAFLFSCLNVFFRDFTHMTEVLLQAVFYASPIIYALDMVPERFRWAFKWNPVTRIVECFRAPIYRGTLPALNDLAAAAIASGVIFLVGLYVFLRNEDQFVLRV